MRCHHVENNRIVRRTPTALVWPVLFVGAVGLWFWLAQGSRMAMWLGAAGFVLTAVLGIVWLLSRARAARRFNAAVDAYAEREIYRQRRRHARRRVRGVSPRGVALMGGSTDGR